MRNVTRWITERNGQNFLSDVRKAIGGAMNPRRIDRLLKALKTVLNGITEPDGLRDPNAARILEEAIAFLEAARDEPKSAASAA